MQTFPPRILEENARLFEALRKSQQKFASKVQFLFENLVKTEIPRLKHAFEEETNEILAKHARKLEEIATIPWTNANFPKELSPKSEFFSQSSRVLKESLNFLENNENFPHNLLENPSKVRENALRQRLEKLKEMDSSSSSSLSSSSLSSEEKVWRKSKKSKEKVKKKAKRGKKVKKSRFDSSFSSSSD